MLQSFLGEVNDLFRFTFTFKELFPSGHHELGCLKRCMSWHREMVGDSYCKTRTAAQIILLLLVSAILFLALSTLPTDCWRCNGWGAWPVIFVQQQDEHLVRCKLNCLVNVSGQCHHVTWHIRWLGHLPGTSQGNMC